MKDKHRDKNPEKRRNVSMPPISAPCIELSGNRELLIEGSRGVLSYAPDEVRVNTSGMIVTVGGRELDLRCISDSALIIDGFITSLSFTV
ncbi:MAG: YabP/YqfC family sporulation protein [Ruminococcus sp.]|nr:YabP/YqfC family sporulation protein [Ruminococcus sp.]